MRYPAYLIFLVLVGIGIPGLAAKNDSTDKDTGGLGISGSGISVERTRFKIKTKDGHFLEPKELIGATFNFRDKSGKPLRVRLDGFINDPRDPTGEVLLYDFTYANAAGERQNICPPGPDGLTKAFPMSGKWTADLRHIPDEKTFNLICTAGALGKCVRFGFKPWGDNLPDGTSRWDLHQACSRAVRADYCGMGEGTTKNGTLIDIWDRYGVNPPDPAGDAEHRLSFEAAFSPEGAVCVARTRIPESATVESLAKTCPRLVGKLGKACDEDEVKKNPKAFIFIKSKDLLQK